MNRWLTKAVALTVLLAGVAAADSQEAKTRKPIGTWEKSVGGVTAKFEFKAEGMRFSMNAGDTAIEADCDYGVTKDGLLFGVLTKVEKKGTNDGPSEGDLFSFRIKVDGETLTLSELKGTESAEARQLIQGDYKKTGK